MCLQFDSDKGLARESLSFLALHSSHSYIGNHSFISSAIHYWQLFKINRRQLSFAKKISYACQNQSFWSEKCSLYCIHTSFAVLCHNQTWGRTALLTVARHLETFFPFYFKTSHHRWFFALFLWTKKPYWCAWDFMYKPAVWPRVQCGRVYTMLKKSNC